MIVREVQSLSTLKMLDCTSGFHEKKFDFDRKCHVQNFEIFKNLSPVVEDQSIVYQKMFFFRFCISIGSAVRAV